MHKNQIYNLFYFTFLFLNEIRNKQFISDDYYSEKFEKFFDQKANVKNIKDFFALIQVADDESLEKVHESANNKSDYMNYIFLYFEKSFNLKISNLPDDDRKYLIHPILHKHIVNYLLKFNREINLFCLTEEIN
jgi:hypothetical protein